MSTGDGDGAELVPAPPQAGEFTHADLVAASAAMLGEPGEATAPALRPHVPSDPGAVPPQLARRGVRGVIVLVLDGLGWHQLLATDAAPWLAARARAQPHPIRAALPSTTATALVSLGTGRRPGDHGILGYTMLWGTEVFNPLVWRIGLRGGGRDVRVEHVPEALVPGPTAFERLQEAGVATTVVLRPELLDSGLTRAGLRGGQRVAAAGLEATLGLARDQVLAAHGPAIAYAHHGAIDTAGHADGPHTEAWRAEVAAADVVLADFATTLPTDVALVVTADHGMVALADDEAFELHDDHPLLAGVTAVAGEPRFRTLRVDEPSRVAQVVSRLAAELGERATVVATADAVAAGWFGPTPPAHARRLGEVLVLSHGRASVPHARVDPHGGRLSGMHGAMTAAERDVPLLVVGAD